MFLNDKILDQSKLNAFADKTTNMTEQDVFVKHYAPALQAFSSFPTMFSKGFFFRVVKTGSVGKELNHEVDWSMNIQYIDQ